MGEMLTRFTILAYFSYFTTTLSFAQESGGNDELPALTVMGQETANQRPVTTYETPISNLDFDPRVDFQSRNMAEAQTILVFGVGLLRIREFSWEVLLCSIHRQVTTLLSCQLHQKWWGTQSVNRCRKCLRGFNSSVGKYLTHR